MWSDGLVAIKPADTLLAPAGSAQSTNFFNREPGQKCCATQLKKSFDGRRLPAALGGNLYPISIRGRPDIFREAMKRFCHSPRIPFWMGFDRFKNLMLIGHTLLHHISYCADVLVLFQ